MDHSYSSLYEWSHLFTPLPLFEWVMCIETSMNLSYLFNLRKNGSYPFKFHEWVISLQPSTFHEWVIFIQTSTFHSPRMDHVCSNFHPPWIISIQTSTLLESVFLSIQTSTQMDHIIIYFFKPQRMKHFYSDHIQIIAIQTSTNGSCLDVFKQFLFPCVLKRFT